MWIHSHSTIDKAGDVSQETCLVDFVRIVGLALLWAGNTWSTFGLGAVIKKVVWQSSVCGDVEWDYGVPLERKIEVKLVEPFC